MSDQQLRDQSIGDLLKRLSEETSTLVRQEMALAVPRSPSRASAPAPVPGCWEAPASPGC
jgi:hypothetical protein